MPSRDPEYQNGTQNTPWNHFVPTMVLMGRRCKDRYDQYTTQFASKFNSSEVQGALRIMPGDVRLRGNTTGSSDVIWSPGSTAADGTFSTSAINFNPTQLQGGTLSQNLAYFHVGDDPSSVCQNSHLTDGSQKWSSGTFAITHLSAGGDSTFTTVPLYFGGSGGATVNVKMANAAKSMSRGDFKFGLSGLLFGTGIEQMLLDQSAIVFEQVVSLSSFMAGGSVENDVIFFGTGIPSNGCRFSQLNSTARVEHIQLTLPNCGADAATALRVTFEQKFRVGTVSYQVCGTRTEPVFADAGEQDVQIEFASYIRPKWSEPGQGMSATGFAYDMLYSCDQAPTECFRIKYIFPLKDASGTATTLGSVSSMTTPLSSSNPYTGTYFAYDPEVNVVDADANPNSGTPTSSALLSGVNRIQAGLSTFSVLFVASAFFKRW
jgi:hypothetical protein